MNDLAVLGFQLRDAARDVTPSDALRASGLLEEMPELAALRGVPQDPEWHPEGDVLTHSLLAADHAAGACREAAIVGERREMLVLAALLHDVGKPGTTIVGADRISSRGHAELGATIIDAMASPRTLPAPSASSWQPI